jgi:hypothetical protein
MFAIVTAIPFNIDKIIFCEFEGSRHGSVGEGPVAMKVIEIVATILEEDADGFLFGFANHTWVNIAPADIGEAANMA